MKARHRKFSDGGEVPEGGRFDSDTYKRARAWMAAGSPESKSEDKPAAKTAAKPATKASTSASYSNEGKNSAAPKSVDRAEIPKDTGYPAPKASERDRGRPTSDFERNVLNTVGAVSGLRGLKPVLMGAKKAFEAGSASRALAKSETPVTYLGASGRKNVTPKEAIGNTDKPRLKGPTSGDRVTQSPGPKSLPPAKASADAPKLSAPKPKMEAPTPKKPAVKVRKPIKASPRERTKFDKYDEGTEFKKGGMVRGSGCATKGKNFKGVM